MDNGEVIRQFVADFKYIERQVRNIQLLIDSCRNFGGAFSPSLEAFQDGIFIKLPRDLVLRFLEEELSIATESLYKESKKLDKVLKVLESEESK